jgi:hypothetical protein
MSLQQQVVNFPNTQINGELLEQVILNNDLSRLTSSQKVEYVKGICRATGLNPVTKPIQIMRFQNREVPYFTKDASEQLRKINGVSIIKVDTQVHDGGLYIVTVYATDKTGRQDCSTGAIVISGLKGDALANALMKAETKAKRRVTLSLCGLGFIDELEVESLPKVQKIDISDLENHPVETRRTCENEFTLDVHLAEIEQCKDLKELERTFVAFRNTYARKEPDLFQKIILAKDIRKAELLSLDAEIEEKFIEIDEETGELLQ